MDNQDPISPDPSPEPEPPAEDDVEELVAFYERTGAMAVNTIGPPIDRPIVPLRRPDRVGDFSFTPQATASPSTSEFAAAPGHPEAQEIREEFLGMLEEQLKRR